jgi:glycosyltransferase involved in cell wall biosynthesis
MPKSRKLLVVSNFYPPRVVGGAEVVAHRHALLFKQAGWDVRAFAGQLPSEATPPGGTEYGMVDGIPVLRVSLQSLDPAENFRWNIANNLLRALICSDRPDLVHFHNVAGLGFDLVRVVKDENIQAAVTLHDYAGHCFRATRLRPDESICQAPAQCQLCANATGLLTVPIMLRREFIVDRLAQADTLIAPSEYLANQYRTVGREFASIRVKSNGINLAAIEPRRRRPGGHVTFLCAAYLGEHKGIRVLLEAARMLLKVGDIRGMWELQIAGHGHLQGEVEEFVGNSNEVQFLGRLSREAMLEVLRRTDVVVLPSIWPENEPVILLEALASGAAIIATDLGGCRELVLRTSSGILVQPNSAEALAACMRDLVLRPQLIEKMSDHNIEQRDELSEDYTVEALGQLLRDGVSRSAPGPVIICDGPLTPDIQLFLCAIDSAGLNPRPRFIWNRWASSSDWKRAVAVWNWSENVALRDLLEPMHQRKHILLRRGDVGRTAAEIYPRVQVYSSISDLNRVIERICQDNSGKLDVPSSSRFGTRLRNMQDYLFTT